MKRLIFTMLAAAFVLTSCCEKHFITDSEYRKSVKEAFEQRKAQFTEGDLFAIFNEQMSEQEREALEFIYAYMPLGDFVDYDPQIFLQGVRSALKTREEVAWGKDIPEEVFRHFVLPIRANNEHLDSSRTLFHTELIDRIKGMNIEEAALEVNHWCHEKVTYRPSDSRTSSPLASMKTAHGRCGEESVFAVAAMRAVGIPARQVYTPRWAHTDDNHAWIEVWTPDGSWKYMGACEPEPKLNMGWFSEPVQRGMLMHTKAFGSYKGQEEFISSSTCFTEVNSTQNYAPIDSARVIVKDASGNVVEGANLFFGIYNYAQFYPCVRRKTDSKGESSAVTGKGDLYIYAEKDGIFGFTKISVGTDSQVVLTLDKREGMVFNADIDVVPPKGGAATVVATDEERKANDLRKEEEVKIRTAYEATFMGEEAARALAAEVGVDADKMAFYIKESRGNWQTIEQFIKEVKPERRAVAMALLSSLSMKDLRDITLQALNDSEKTASIDKISDAIYVENVINPRVRAEMVAPYKEILRKGLDSELAKKAISDPMTLVGWINQTIKINNTDNSYRVALSPSGVWRSKLADTDSRNIFFVAVARSLDIPARVDYLTGKVQYHNGTSWIDVKFNTEGESIKAATGTLKIKYSKAAGVDDPLYDRHFTVQRFEGGEFKLLNFRSSDGTEGTNSMLNLFTDGQELEEGYYILTIGTRMASGKALVSTQTFTIKSGETTTISATMREDKEDIQVIGGIDPEAMFQKEGDTVDGSILATTGRGYFILAVIKARHEPTTHTIRDLVRGAASFEKWGRKIILLFENEQELASFNKSEFGKLPENVVFGVDKEGKVAKMMIDGAKIENKTSRPIFMIADTFGRVVYVTSGYSIGVGEQMLTVIDKL